MSTTAHQPRSARRRVPRAGAHGNRPLRGMLADPHSLSGQRTVRRPGTLVPEQHDLSVHSARERLIEAANHEFRTPLSIVIGYAEMLLSGDAGPLTDEQAAMLQRVERNGAHLLTLTQDLVEGASIALGGGPEVVRPS